MTCLEKYKLDNSESKIKLDNVIEIGCPSDYGYCDRPIYCYDFNSDFTCEDCWNRNLSKNYKEEVENKEEILVSLELEDGKDCSMYRVYDKKTENWIRDNVYLTPTEDIYIVKKRKIFGYEKTSLVSEDRYIWQKEIGLQDKNKILIFEGDICRLENKKDVVGVVTYIKEHASYYLLDNKNKSYYILDEAFCKNMKIIGNVFNNKDLLKEN